MKLISWNVNGIRAVMDKGFKEFFSSVDADMFAIQETKMQEGQADIEIEGYHRYMASAIKKGYSGTLIYTKLKPLSVHYGLLDNKYDDEGRAITLEFDNFYFITLYSPNSQEELKRLDYRMVYEEDLKAYLATLNKPIILCGDLNVAHEEIDIKNPKANIRNAGFTIEERTALTNLLNLGYIDTFRYLNPDLVKYSWWSYRFNARKNNAGWRIDYFLVSKAIKDNLVNADIYTDVFGSDHAPILLDIKI